MNPFYVDACIGDANLIAAAKARGALAPLARDSRLDNEGEVPEETPAVRLADVHTVPVADDDGRTSDPEAVMELVSKRDSEERDGGKVDEYIGVLQILMQDLVEKYKTEVIERMMHDRNAQRACQAKGVLDDLNATSAKLEKTQKSLDQNLESERQLFRRFYLLSNDDLLEILGQEKDPMQVQKHFKKMFVGLRVLELTIPMMQGNKMIKAIGLVSNDG